MSCSRNFATTSIVAAAAIILAWLPGSAMAYEDTPAAIELRQQERETQLENLQPLLIGKGELEALRQRLGGAATPWTRAPGAAPSQPLSQPFVADLYLVYALNSSDPAPLLSEGLLEQWGIEPEVMHLRALANLRKKFGEIHDKPVGKLPWLHVIDSDDSYAASRLLLLEEWGAIAARLGEPLIVAVPTPSVVVFTASRDTEQLQQLRDTVETLAEHEERPVSRHLFVWHRDGWRLLESLD
jgi:hypothetical protein